MRMLVRVVMKQSTALIVPHTSAAVASSLTLLDADLGFAGGALPSNTDCSSITYVGHMIQSTF